jgi:NADP-dependent 3-hydroxy acid dehydrogenase YdfG
MNRIVLITGATAGIGEATARMFAKEGDHLILTGRRTDRLNSLKKELENVFNARTYLLTFDIRSNKEVEAAIDSLPEDWRRIDILVNNAGLAAGLDPVQDASIDDWDIMIDTNVKGLLYITRKILPWMIKRKQGHIINVGSIAGKEVYSKGGIYCATKHAVDALSKGMRIDLVDTGIKVSQVSPGAVETEFSMVRFKGDKERAEKVYQGYQPLKAEDIAEVIRFTTSLPKHVNINDVLVMPTAQANSTVFDKI